MDDIERKRIASAKADRYIADQERRLGPISGSCPPINLRSSPSEFEKVAKALGSLAEKKDQGREESSLGPWIAAMEEHERDVSLDRFKL